MSTRLNQVRKEIDELDVAIQKLLVARGELAMEIAKAKSQESRPVYYCPWREADVIDAVQARDCGVFTPAQMADIFYVIMAKCRGLQHPLSVACLGPEGTYSSLVVQAHFKTGFSYHYCDSFKAILQAITLGDADYGLLAIANSRSGLIAETCQLLLATTLPVCAQHWQRIDHALMTVDPSQTITTIYAHEQSFKQCQAYLTQHYGNAKQVTVASNGVGAQLAAQQPGTAAIASASQVDRFKLSIVATELCDADDNSTRFLVVNRQWPLPTASDTSLVLFHQISKEQEDHLLESASVNQLTMTNITAASDNEWLLFDIACHYRDHRLQQWLDQCTVPTSQYRMLGSAVTR